MLIGDSNLLQFGKQRSESLKLIASWKINSQIAELLPLGRNGLRDIQRESLVLVLNKLGSNMRLQLI